MKGLPIVWRAIPRYPRYEVSNDGRVRSLENHPGKQRRVPRQMRPFCSAGYLRVGLSARANEYHNELIHRLVLEAFVGPPPEGYEAAHLDGDKQNNCLDNLAWKTPAENEADKRRHGTAAVGSRNGWATLTEADVARIRELHAAGANCALLGRLFGISRGHAHKIVTGAAWKHVQSPNGDNAQMRLPIGRTA